MSYFQNKTPPYYLPARASRVLITCAVNFHQETLFVLHFLADSEDALLDPPEVISGGKVVGHNSTWWGTRCSCEKDNNN
jgi:hypothetical protein